MIKHGSSSPTHSPSYSPPETDASIPAAKFLAPSGSSESNDTTGRQKSPVQDNRDRTETAGSLSPHRLPVSPTQQHFSPLSPGTQAQSSALSLRKGTGPKKNHQTAEEKLARAAANKTAALAQTPEERAKAKADKAHAAEAKSAAANQKPLTTAQSWAAHAKAVGDEEATKDFADRSLATLPPQMPLKAADEKIHKYSFNWAHKDGAGKANGLKALGHPTKPGGTEYPLTKEMYDHGERFKKEITTGAENSPAEMTSQDALKIAKDGVKFKVTAPLEGVGEKT